MKYNDKDICPMCKQPHDRGLRLLDVTLWALFKEIITISKAKSLIGVDMVTMRCLRAEYFKEEI